MNLRERWEKQNNSVKLLMKKLRRHDTFVVTVAVIIALVLCGGLIYMSTPVVAASARDQVVEKENKNNEKTTEKLDELHNYLTDIDKMIVKNQKGIDSYYEKTNNDRLEGDKTTDTVKEKVVGLGTDLRNIHTSVNSTETRIESLKELIESGNGETREKAAKEFDAIGKDIENIKIEYENVKKQNKDLMEKLDGAIRTEVKNGNEKISTDSIKRYEELLSKLTEFDKELEKRNVESVADLKSEFESLSEALGKRVDEKIDDYNSESKARGEALDQKIENYNSDNKAMGEALGEKIENYNSESKARGDKIDERITNVNSDINNNINANINGIKGYIDEKTAGISNKLDQVFQRVSNGKKLLASALLTKGVKIKEDATFMEFARAIEKIPTQVVVDSGDTAASIEYDYHYHKDGRGQNCGDNLVATDRYGGCFTTPVYHRHSDACYRTVNTYIISTTKDTRNRGHVKDYHDGTPVYSYECKYCGARFNDTHARHEETVYSLEEARDRNGRVERVITDTVLVCNKNESTVEGYSPSCGFAHGQVVSAHIKFNGRYSGYNSTVPAIKSSGALRSRNSIATKAIKAPIVNLDINLDDINSRLEEMKSYEEDVEKDEEKEEIADNTNNTSNLSEPIKEELNSQSVDVQALSEENSDKTDDENAGDKEVSDSEVNETDEVKKDELSDDIKAPADEDELQSGNEQKEGDDVENADNSETAIP
ncbi:MAG: apolipoprotein A1/A4/E family protein [Butyrivibrio sp.]|nr:apolipoprotein A1/A4/E family protein [Butyrivibrio sp.]